MRRTVTAASLAMCMLLPLVAEASPKPKRMTYRGQVTDLNGEGIAAVPVRVLASRRVLKFLSIESTPAQTELASTRTDAAGFYEISIPKLREYDFYFLRFYDRTEFDLVKYSIPADVEITSHVNRRRSQVIDQALPFAPGWDAVQRLVDLYGASSIRGQIVRRLGVPDRTEQVASAGGAERITWWYDLAGIAYIIEGGEVIDKKTFDPLSQESPAIAHR